MDSYRLAIAAVAAAFAIPGSAQASVVVGSPLTNADSAGGNCGSSGVCTQWNTALPGATLTSPMDGVVVTLRVRTNTASTFRARVLRAAPASTAKVIQSSPFQSFPGTNAAVAMDVRLPVEKNDVIALGLPTNGHIPDAVTNGASGACFDPMAPDPADGTTGATVAPCSGNEELLYNVSIEPDADHDGFGDETQDTCPSDPSTQGPCKPQLSLTGSISPATVAPGGDATLTLHVDNPGAGGADGVTVSAPLPSGLTATSAATTAGTCSTGQALSCSLGSLAPGASAAMLVTVHAAAPGNYGFTASVASSPGDSDPSDNAVSLNLAVPAPAPVDKTPPALSAFGLSPTRFAALPFGASIAKATPLGTRVSYTLSENATVTFSVERGRRVKHRLRYTKLRGSFQHRGVKGRNRLRFTGRFAGRTLRPGRYRLVAVPRDAAGNQGTARRVAFVIARRRA